jgi:hypothetical protein
MNTKELVSKYRHTFNTDYTADANCESAWLLLEGVGSTIDDSSANVNDGTFVLGKEPTWSTDTPNASIPYSLNFVVANTQYITTAKSYGGKPWTGVAWVKIADTSAVRTIFGGSANGMQFRISSAEKINLTKTGTADIATSTGAITVGEWVHIAASYDASGNYAFLINGSASGAGTNDMSISVTDTAIGRRTSAEYFDGNMAEMASFTRVLSSTEINEIYDYGLKGSVAPTSSTTFIGRSIAVGIGMGIFN